MKTLIVVCLILSTPTLWANQLGPVKASDIAVTIEGEKPMVIEVKAKGRLVFRERVFTDTNSMEYIRLEDDERKDVIVNKKSESPALTHYLIGINLALANHGDTEIDFTLEGLKTRLGLHKDKLIIANPKAHAIREIKKDYQIPHVTEAQEDEHLFLQKEIKERRFEIDILEVFNPTSSKLLDLKMDLAKMQTRLTEMTAELDAIRAEGDAKFQNLTGREELITAYLNVSATLRREYHSPSALIQRSSKTSKRAIYNGHLLSGDFKEDRGENPFQYEYYQEMYQYLKSWKDQEEKVRAE